MFLHRLPSLFLHLPTPLPAANPSHCHLNDARLFNPLPASPNRFTCQETSGGNSSQTPHPTRTQESASFSASNAASPEYHCQSTRRPDPRCFLFLLDSPQKQNKKRSTTAQDTCAPTRPREAGFAGPSLREELWRRARSIPRAPRSQPPFGVSPAGLRSLRPAAPRPSSSRTRVRGPGW